MNRTQLNVLRVVLLLSVIYSMRAGAQTAGVEEVIRLSSIKIAKIETPKYEVKRAVPSLASATREQNWIEISLPYKTSPAWMDELSVTFFVLLEPKDEPGVKYKMLTGTVDYVNIKKGVHRSVVYLHPSTLERYGEPKRYAAVMSASYGGRPLEMATEDKAWWKQLPGESGLVLNRMQTPFAMLNYNDFEALSFPQEKK